MPFSTKNWGLWNNSLGGGGGVVGISSANDLGHVEILLLGEQQGVKALLEVAGAVAVRPANERRTTLKNTPIAQSYVKVVEYGHPSNYWISKTTRVRRFHKKFGAKTA